MIVRAVSMLLAAAGALAAQPATVEGRVTNTVDGKPVREATVMLRGTVRSGTPPNVDSYVTETGSTGRFQVYLPPGKYQVMPSHSGFTAGLPEPLAGPTLLTLEPGQHAVLALQLVPDGVISGRVVDQDGDPLRNAGVEVLHYSYLYGRRQLSGVRSAVTNDRGEYRAYGLPPGSYYLRASAPPAGGIVMNNERPRRTQPARSFAATFYPDAREAAQTAPLELKPGAELTNVDIRLLREMVYSVRVKLPEPLDGSSRYPNITLLRRPPDSDPFGGYSQTMRNGAFEFDGVPPGSFVLTAALAGAVGKGPVQFARQFVEVTDHDVEVPALDFVSTIEVAGTVKVEGALSSPLQNMRVILLPREPGPDGGNAFVDADGAFVIHYALPEPCQLHVAPVPRGAYLKAVKLGDRVLPDLEVDLTGGARAITILLATDGGRIEGQVRNAEGQPAASVTITLVPDGAHRGRPDRLKTATTGDEGEYLFQEIAPGGYRLFAWQNAEAGAPLDAEFRKPFEKLSVAVTVEPSSRHTVPLNTITVKPASR